ncbi:MAG: cytochrome c nitrite reductase small subunit [Candidatus Accumulibacter sp.]|jgi:cytochrome c nitrite reductase small subunit|nr:cytochrome c nitrite reductase small subunit [Accumulibacter sp.]
MSERSSCGFFKGILEALPAKAVVPLLVLGGAALGLAGYNVYVSKAFSYLEDDPAVCVNCHIMAPFYQAWSKSSHANWTTCNDCHAPQHNRLAGLLFKAKDGLYHAAQFTLNDDPSAIRPNPGMQKVIQANCVRCHTQVTTEFVSAGKAQFADIEHGRQQACWGCHRDVPHTTNSGLASAPNAIVPLPASPVPGWLKDLMR